MKFYKSGKFINYETVVNDEAPFTYEIKDSTVYLNVKKNHKIHDIVEFLYLNFEKLYRKSFDAEYRKFDGKEVVHYLGKKYIVKTKKSDKNEMVLDKDTITVYCKKNDITQHKAIYRKYLKRAVEQVIVKIYFDIEQDFREIKIPKFTVKGLDRRRWAYNAGDTIYLSYLLGKYDEKYIKTIIYHELCHYFIIEHNEYFYRLLDSKLENGQTLEKEFDNIEYTDKF